MRQPTQADEHADAGSPVVEQPTPYEAAIAVSRAMQTDPAEARSLLCSYANDGIDPIRIAYCQSRLLAQADTRIGMLAGQEQGAWLSHLGASIALNSTFDAS